MTTGRDAPGGGRLLVLGWHFVEGTWRFPSPPGSGLPRLERQLRAVAKIATIVPLPGALRALREGRPLPPRAVAITFDDGYRDNLTLAVPLLSRLGIPATMFLVPGFLSGEVSHWSERLAWAFARARARSVDFQGTRFDLTTTAARVKAIAETERDLVPHDRLQRSVMIDLLIDQLEPVGSFNSDALFLDWDGARQLVRTGVTIGSHSMYHTVLAAERAEAQQADLAESRRQLQRELALPIDVFAYPFGKREHYNAATTAAAKAAGYAHAVTTRALWNTSSTSPYEIRRRMLSPQQGARGLATVMARGLALVARERLTAQRAEMCAANGEAG
ncbi:MAG: polysaccharide deacetylase family protein [Egibacteraceae bacterium]